MKQLQHIQQWLKEQQQVLGIAACVLVLVLCISFAGRHQEQVLLQDVQVSIQNPDLQFLHETELLDLLNNHLYRSEGTHKVAELDLAALEGRLEGNPYVADATVFSTLNGKIRAKVMQKEPVLRIMKSDGSGFYVDAHGLKFPLSKQYSARTLVVTGHVQEGLLMDSIQTETLQKVFAFRQQLDRHPDWRAMTGSLEITKEQELVLVPRVGRAKVLLGNFNDLGQKMQNLFLFYQQNLNNQQAGQYRWLNLKYKNQIIANK